MQSDLRTSREPLQFCKPIPELRASPCNFANRVPNFARAFAILQTDSRTSRESLQFCKPIPELRASPCNFANRFPNFAHGFESAQFNFRTSRMDLHFWEVSENSKQTNLGWPEARNYKKLVKIGLPGNSCVWPVCCSPGRLFWRFRRWPQFHFVPQRLSSCPLGACPSLWEVCPAAG
jgi:hypothetical protein